MRWRPRSASTGWKTATTRSSRARRQAAPSGKRGTKASARWPTSWRTSRRRRAGCELGALEAGAGAALDGGADEMFDLQAVAQHLQQPRLLLADHAVRRSAV